MARHVASEARLRSVLSLLAAGERVRVTVQEDDDLVAFCTDMEPWPLRNVASVWTAGEGSDLELFVKAPEQPARIA